MSNPARKSFEYDRDYMAREAETAEAWVESVNLTSTISVPTTLMVYSARPAKAIGMDDSPLA
ncbi:hypothetical protein N8I74_01510 [Chitiniphilus purpureus]|uniref:Uncharacterized protein n=1 Tax=Chitiniphilus purpureus TaxID=2981137 RepID=A0ABY6DMY9_9NEIS|nr:hypothetical protein [Chitiniphilus sp. CD1]UXY15719.1 hypothetical protein N8I74_01510 [Chitiniphilus sp. CD1]